MVIVLVIQSYWKQRRIRESNKALQKSINQLDDKIKGYYIELAERLKKEIAAYYGKILTDTPQDAVRTHQLLFGRQMELYNEIVEHLTTIGVKMEKDM